MSKASAKAAKKQNQQKPAKAVTPPVVKPAPVAKPAQPAPAAAAAAKAEVLPDIYANTIALALDRSTYGNRRKVSLANVAVDADKNMLTLTKRLLNSPELKAINAIMAEASQYLADKSVPAFFKPGIHLVPFAAVGDVDAKLTELKAKLFGPLPNGETCAVDAFIAAYPAQIAIMKDVLREMFNEGDYLTADQMRSQFAFTWRYLNLGAPSQLQSINAKIFNEQRALVAAQVQEAALEIRQMMRATMLELVEHMRERLTPDADGKPKMFRESMIERFNAFIDNFNVRNVTDDAALKAVVEQARALVNGVDADVLRNDKLRRDAINSGLDAVKATLDTMVVKQGRFIHLDDAAPAVPTGIMTAARKAALTRSARKQGTAPAAVAPAPAAPAAVA
jgi:hypothetical protein